MMKYIARYLLAGSLVSLTLQAAEAQEADFSANAQLAVVAVYLPSYATFSNEARVFLTHVDTLCQVPSIDNFNGTRHRFAELVYGFARVEFYRVGPMLEENRQNRLFYWPDKRRVGERQMRNFLSSDNLAHIELVEFQQKSVALQGFPAIERLLFARTAEQIFTASEPFTHCAALQLIAANVDDMAHDLYTAWQLEDGIAKQFVEPEESSSQFRTHTEVLRSMVTQIGVAVDNVMTRKLTPVLDNREKPATSAPLWRSGATAEMLAGNIESIRALVIDSGLASATNLDEELVFEFRTAKNLLDKLQALPTLGDDAGALTQEAESLFRSTLAVLGGIRSTLNDRFMTKLNVRAGFNSDDGD